MSQTIPESWVRVPVVGYYTYEDGSPVNGYVTFIASQAVLAGSTVIVPVSITARIVNGQLNTSLLATDDPVLNFQGWHYIVNERYRGARPAFRIPVSRNLDLIDLGLVAPLVEPDQLVSTRGPTGDVTPAAQQALGAALDAQAAAEAAADRAETAVGGNFTQAAADARYLQQSQLNAAGGVAGLNANSLLDPNALPEPLVSYDLLIASLLA